MCVCVQCWCLYWDQLKLNGMLNTGVFSSKNEGFQFWFECIRTILDEMLCGKLIRHQRDSVGKDQIIYRQANRACIQHLRERNQDSFLKASSRHILFPCIELSIWITKGMYSISTLSDFKSSFFCLQSYNILSPSLDSVIPLVAQWASSWVLSSDPDAEQQRSVQVLMFTPQNHSLRVSANRIVQVYIM